MHICGYQHVSTQRDVDELFTSKTPSAFHSMIIENKIREVIEGLEYQRLSYLSKKQQPVPLSVLLTMTMAEGTVTSSIPMTPLPSSLGRRDVGLRTVNDIYDEERAETSPRARVGKPSNYNSSTKDREIWEMIILV